MSHPHNEAKTLEERYEMLQSLFKQQIMLNETLKSELTRLGSLYRKVSMERDLLLSHVAENERITVPVGINSTDPPTRCPSPKRDAHKRIADSHCPTPLPTKKLKPEEEKLLIPRIPDGGMGICSESSPTVDRASSSNPSTTSRHIPADKPTTDTPTNRTQFSRLQSMVSQLNSPVYPSVLDPCSSKARDSPRDDSPPPITVTGPTLQQRSVKSASLLSNSSVGGAVPLSANKNASAGIQFTKGAPVPVNRIGTAGLVNRHSLPINLLRNSGNRLSTSTTQLSHPQSPQGTSPLRMPVSVGGPRILIQPSSTNVRPAVLQTTEPLR